MRSPQLRELGPAIRRFSSNWFDETQTVASQDDLLANIAAIIKDANDHGELT
jgi:hypothetical protein